MKPFIIKHAIAGSVVLIILALLNWVLIAPYYTVKTSQAFGWLGITLALLCVPMGIKHYRDKINDGVVTFAKGLEVGLLITLVVAVFMFFYGMLFFVFEGEKFQVWQLKDLQGEELEAMKAQLAALPEYAFTPWFQGVIMFGMIFFIGLALTLLGAIILRSRGPVI
ncbi:MAG: DUF4199 domain-containing protein [Bacteroidota bacterium]